MCIRDSANVTDSRYNTNTSGVFNVTVWGDLWNRLQIPNGTEHLRGTNVTIRFNITDYECPENLEDVPLENINITMISENSTEYTCSPIINESSGWYSCTFNTSGMDTRGYSITIRSQRDYYNNGTYTYDYVEGVSSFWIETIPILQGEKVVPLVGGFSETFTFTVNVTDEDLDQVTVDAYYRVLPSGSWTWFDSATQSGINWTATFTKVWGPSFVDKDMQVKFNASEDDIWNYTSSVLNFTVERDDVLFVYVAGNGSTVNRVGTNYVTLMLQAFDNDTADPLANPLKNQYYDFWVTSNGSGTDSWIRVTTGSELTNDSGHMWVNFDPDSNCLFKVGPQNWKGGISPGSLYYKDQNSSIYNLTITSEYAVSYTHLTLPTN